MTNESGKKLSGQQVRQLAEALTSAFPRKSDLERLIRYGLDRSLSEIAGGDTVSEIVFQVIEWAEAQGRVADLITAAIAENPRNPQLKKCAEQLHVGASPAQLAPIAMPTPGKFSVLVDQSHGQAEWESFLFRDNSTELLQSLLPPSEEIRWQLQKIHMREQFTPDTLNGWPGLILGIPHHIRIEETTRYEIVNWVRAGGYLVMLGFELGERHHETNLNELASEFGLRFNSDIVAPKDWLHEPLKPYGEPVEFSDIRSDHPVLKKVRSLCLWNLCTLTVEPGAEVLLSLGDNRIGWLQSGVTYTSKGWLRGGNQKFAIKDASWVPVIAEAPKGLTGQGHVLAIGTWELIGRAGHVPRGFDNLRFISNLLDWCGAGHPTQPVHGKVTQHPS